MAGYTVDDLRLAVAAAVRAPSLHNSQPWRFRLAGGAIEVLADRSRQLAIADTAGWAVRMACGAATFNARMALAAAGVPAVAELRPYRETIARLTPAAPRRPTCAEEELASAIARRFSNRKPFFSDPVPSQSRVRLIEAARTESARLELIIGTAALAAFGEIAGSADRVLRRNPGYQAEMATWAQVGVPIPAGALLPQRHYIDRDWDPEPLVAILGTPGDLPVDQVVAGQALQRVLLTATAEGLASSMISQPVEVPAARERLQRSLRVGVPQIALRLGYGQPGRPAARRPVAEVSFVDSGLVAGRKDT
ncbi:nitroreductase [Actinoplanes sp. TFC3]|uniref:Acg family FMN-binding oxidoreductase n=1 Tax=Actinoplanes sp. TFC3 TaxID=1710355 RepID=UPI00082CE0D9|nr:nitroreductase [Actinoplanes sp. TFC3]